MVCSMTAFARNRQEAQWGVLSWELRSVNHRFLEASVRMPEDLRVIEPAVRNLVSKKLSRGKVECNLRFQAAMEEKAEFSVNTALAKQIADSSRKIDHLLYNPASVNAMDILRWPGVLTTSETDWDMLQKQALTLLETALDELIESRQREGQALQEIITKRLDGMQREVEKVRGFMPELLQAQREKIENRIKEMAVDVDEARLAQEVAMLAQKMDVDEEMDRLETHIKEVRRTLKQKKPIGRRLDFLMQELNREANTLGSKSVSSDSTQSSVELKVLIEQMREQVQNIE